MDTYRVLSSKKSEDGKISWDVSVRLNYADAKKLAAFLAEETKRDTQVVEEKEEVKFIHPCGGCLHLEIGSCDGDEHTCEEFKRFK